MRSFYGLLTVLAVSILIARRFQLKKAGINIWDVRNPKVSDTYFALFLSLMWLNQTMYYLGASHAVFKALAVPTLLVSLIPATHYILSWQKAKTLKRLPDSAHVIAPTLHEQISDAKILTGLNDIYIDLSGIKTKTIIEFHLDPDTIKAGLKERLQSSGIRLTEDRKSARCRLEFQIVPAMLSENEKLLRAAAVLASVKEILTNDRIRANKIINVMSPVWQRQNLAIFKESLAAEVFQKLFLGSVDAFIEAWQDANKQEANK